MEKKLEYRMYGAVPYNISEIQRGIQFGHAVVEYGLKFGKTDEYLQWAKNDKTFIILNGGTTNLNFGSLGSLNEHLQYVKEFLKLDVAEFYEPDLGDQLTAFVFLVDERVWDKKAYPSYSTYIFEMQKGVQVNSMVSIEFITEDKYYEQMWGEEWKILLNTREFLETKRLA